jgi:hypothetical protein
MSLNATDYLHCNNPPGCVHTHRYYYCIDSFQGTGRLLLQHAHTYAAVHVVL